MSILSELLSSKTRAEILRLLFGPDKVELHMREMARQANCAIGTMQTELKKLGNLDLVVPRKDGNRTYYRANTAHPIFHDLRSLVLKTVGLVDVLRQALGNNTEIRIAFVFGSIARQEEMAGSDIDLLIVGSLGLRDVTRLLAGMPEQLGREINPHVMSEEDFLGRKVAGDHFINQVIASQKILIVGNHHDLETMVR